MSTELLSDVGAKDGPSATRASEWGLASVLIGCTMVLAAPTTMVFNVLLWHFGPANLDRRLAFAGSIVGLSALLFVCLFGIGAGYVGCTQQKGWRPSPLPMAGFVISLTAFVLWIVVAVDLMAIIESFRP